MSAQEGLAPHSWTMSHVGWKCRWCDVRMSPGDLICKVGPPTDWEARGLAAESELAEARKRETDLIRRNAEVGFKLFGVRADNASLREALRNFVDIDDRDNLTDPDRAPTDEWRAEVIQIARAALAGHEQAVTGNPRVRINEMRLSDGRTDYFVGITVADRDLDFHKFEQEYQAKYTAAEMHWLLYGGEKPDILDYNEDGSPASPGKGAE